LEGDILKTVNFNPFTEFKYLRAITNGKVISDVLPITFMNCSPPKLLSPTISGNYTLRLGLETIAISRPSLIGVLKQPFCGNLSSNPCQPTYTFSPLSENIYMSDKEEVIMANRSYQGVVNVTFDKKCEVFEPISISIDVTVCGSEEVRSTLGPITVNSTGEDFTMDGDEVLKMFSSSDYSCGVQNVTLVDSKDNKTIPVNIRDT
jgi:hypothetical protein